MKFCGLINHCDCEFCAGIIFTLNMKAMAAASGDTDTAASQHCFDFPLFQHRSHICDPGSIQRIADTLGSGLIFACLAAGGESTRK